MAGTWTGIYRFVVHSGTCAGAWWTCPVKLIFEDASGDGSAFFVERPATTEYCYISDHDCFNGGLYTKEYIAFCDNSKVDMEGFQGLVSSTKLMLSKEPSSDGEYNMHK